MRVVFLDIDGVLCTLRSHIGQGHIGLMEALDREAVGLLNRATLPGTAFVLSSTWRLTHDRAEMTAHLRAYGWTGEFHDDWRTKDLWKTRGGEVDEWLGRHPEVSAYAIVDDDSDFLPEQLGHLVKTQYEDGLSWAGFQRLNEVLHGDKDAWFAATRPTFPYEYDPAKES